MYLCTLVTCHESEQSSDGIVLSYRCKTFIMILSPVLCETLGTETSCVVAIILDLKYSASFDYFGIGWLRYQSPDIVAHNGFIFSMHCLLPLFRIFPIHCFPIISWPD